MLDTIPSAEVYTIPHPLDLWCGVEVEIWEVPKGVYVRVNATRATALRESKQEGTLIKNPGAEKQAKLLGRRLFNKYTHWLKERKTDFDTLRDPWTPKEIRRLRKFQDEPSCASLRIHIENAAAEQSGKKAKSLYVLAERLMIKGKPWEEK